MSRPPARQQQPKTHLSGDGGAGGRFRLAVAHGHVWLKTRAAAPSWEQQSRHPVSALQTGGGRPGRSGSRAAVGITVWQSGGSAVPSATHAPGLVRKHRQPPCCAGRLLTPRPFRRHFLRAPIHRCPAAKHAPRSRPVRPPCSRLYHAHWVCVRRRLKSLRALLQSEGGFFCCAVAPTTSPTSHGGHRHPAKPARGLGAETEPERPRDRDRQASLGLARATSPPTGRPLNRVRSDPLASSANLEAYAVQGEPAASEGLNRSTQPVT